MKIVHILAGKANPNTLNGVNKVVHNLATQQSVNGFDVIVYGVANNLNDGHYHIYPLKLFLKSRIKIFPPITILKYLNKNKDTNTVFHFHSSFITWYIFLIIYIKLFRLGKVVFTPHGQYAEAKLNRFFLKKLYFILFESIILRVSDKIHIIGKSEINKYTEKYIANKYESIPNAYDVFEESDRTQIENIEIVFGYLGRLDIIQKGLDVLLKGFALYKKQGGKGVLKIAGLGEDEKRLKVLAKTLNIGDNIEFVGAVFDDDKINFYKSISVFVHTSRWEGVPTACLEAASHGLPLLISDETNMGELVQQYDCGYVLHNNKPTNVKEGLDYFSQLSKSDMEEKKNRVYIMLQKELKLSYINSKIVDKLYQNSY